MTANNDEIRRLREVLREKNGTLRKHQNELDVALTQIRNSFEHRITKAKINIEEASYELNYAIAAQALIDNVDMPIHLLYEWKKPNLLWSQVGKWELTGTIGRYEIRTPESKFRGHPYSISIGDKFIRILKKNGTPSLSWNSIKSSSIWLPDGERP